MWLPVIAVSLLSLVCVSSELNDDRISGGDLTSIIDVPYQVSLQLGGRHFCAGAIISPKIIVSASHCFRTFDPKNTDELTVRLGSTYKNKGGIVKGIETFLMHPEFNGVTIENDIVLVKLKSEVIESGAVRFVEVATSLPSDGTPCRISGWGRMKHGVRDTPDGLQSAIVNYISTERCQSDEMYGTPSNVKDSMICAKAVGKASLQEDSGGPLVTTDDIKLIGITSFGPGYDTETYPDVYTKVPMFAQWIAENSKTL